MTGPGLPNGALVPGSMVTPGRLRFVATRYQLIQAHPAGSSGEPFRSFVCDSKQSDAGKMAQSIMKCAQLTAVDGFVYNTCVWYPAQNACGPTDMFSLERMLRHKLSFVASIARLPPPMWKGIRRQTRAAIWAPQ